MGRDTQDVRSATLLHAIHIEQRGTGRTPVRCEVDAVKRYEAALHAQRHELLLRPRVRHSTLVHPRMREAVGQSKAQLVHLRQPADFLAAAFFVSVSD